MPINFSGAPFKLSPQDMGVPDYASAISSGLRNASGLMDTAFKPKNLAEDLLAKQLGNKINAVKAKYADQLARAQIEKLMRGPAPVLSNLEKAINGSQRIKATYGENSPEYKAAQNYIQKLSVGSQGGGDKIPSNKVGQLLYLKSHPELLGNVPNEDSYVESIFPNTQNQYEPTKKPDYDSMILNALNSQGKEGTYQGPAREAKDLERLKDEVGEDSPVYQQALRLSAMKEKTSETMNKKRERQATGLKPGENYITENNENVGISRAPSTNELKEMKGRAFFNPVYEFILNSTAPYSGEGSILRFGDDIAMYNKKDDAKKRIDNYIAAIQLAPSTMVKENATIGGANTNQVYNRLLDSLVASDLPKNVESLAKKYALPYSAKLRAGKIFQQKLNEGTEASKNLSPRINEYFNGLRKGHIYDPKTNRLKEVHVKPTDWDKFLAAGGY